MEVTERERLMLNGFRFLAPFLIFGHDTGDFEKARYANHSGRQDRACDLVDSVAKIVCKTGERDVLLKVFKRLDGAAWENVYTVHAVNTSETGPMSVTVIHDARK